MPIKATPIERIFREVVKRKMTPAERKILLGVQTKTRKSKKNKTLRLRVFKVNAVASGAA